MASIGGLVLGAEPSSDGYPYKAGVACQLIKPLSIDLAFDVKGQDWQVRGKKNGRYLVASHPSEISFEEAKTQGVSALMEALDLACIQQNEGNNLRHPSDNIIVLFVEDGCSILTVDYTFDLSIGVSFQVQVTNSLGQVIPNEEPAPPKWHRSLRYYRLSQIAADIYEAYRNLYLAFEALVETIYPREKTEREGDWIRRCFTRMREEFNLAAFAPDKHSHPNEYLYGVLYEHTRCNLFHSRTTDAILPYYQLDTQKIRVAYDTLLRLWRHIASKILGTNNGGGVITFIGYRTQMDAVLSESPLLVSVSDDNSPPKESDTMVSHSGRPAVALSSCRYAGEITPGTVGAFFAEDNDPMKFPTIHRIGLVRDNGLYGIGFIEEGLRLDGVDSFRVRAYQRLIQGSQPRTIF